MAHKTWKRRHLGKMRVMVLEARTAPATFTVNWPGDGSFGGSTNLRQAITAANSNSGADTIVFSGIAASGISTLTAGEIAITDSLTIIGPGAGTLTISGNNADRVFNITSKMKTMSVTISDLTIANGNVAGPGGAIYNQGKTLTLNYCIIANNTTTGMYSGGGINCNDGLLTLNGCTVTGNMAGLNGGGIDANTSATLKIFDSNISGNTAAFRGGGIGIGSSSLLLERSLVSANLRGGISIIGTASTGGLTLRNATISGNSTTSTGGGIHIQSSTGTLDVQNCTITGNTSEVLGGGIYCREAGSLAIESTIFVGNSSVGSSSQIHNFMGTTAVSFKTSALHDVATYTNLGGNIIGTDMKLGPLADNGGPTQTHALLSGSPCIDAGSNPVGAAVDQRGTGYPRAVNTIPDIGAVESHDLLVKNDNDVGASSLRQTILDANAIIGANSIQFDSTFFNVSKTIPLLSGQLSIADSLTIVGPGAKLASISGGNSSRVFNISGPGTITVAISDLTIADGKVAETGAGVNSTAENVTLSNCVISNNVATNFRSGGGVASPGGGSLTLINCAVTGNQAGNNGGGVDGNSGVSITIQSCTFFNNSCTGAGGGVSLAGNLVIENSTFSGNTAGSGGAVNSYQPITIRNSTITANSASSGGGVRQFGSSTITLESSIVQGNTGGSSPDILADGNVTAKTSAIGSLDGITTFTNNGGNLIGQDIKLGPLADNGGPTKTHALLPGSAAIDKGSNPMVLTLDQRGLVRESPTGKIDIGAYERSAPPPTVSHVQINDGGPQRSRITSLTITFDQIVTLPMQVETAFELKRQTDNQTPALKAAVDNSGSTTVVTLTFTGATAVDFGSLADGRYTLTVFANSVNNGNGALDGNGDLIVGDDYVLASATSPNPATNVFRLFGDADGDGAVTSNDFALFRQTFGTSLNLAFDFNNNTTIDSDDFSEFRKRFGISVVP